MWTGAARPPSSASTSTSPCWTAAWPTTRAFAPPCRRCGTCASRARKSSCCRTWAGLTARRLANTHSDPWPSASARCWVRRARSPRTALDDPKRPFVAIVGGAKVSSKLAVLENLIARVDTLLIGGGMANTFFKAEGREVGRSLLEPDLVEAARNLLALGNKIVLPKDV